MNIKGLNEGNVLLMQWFFVVVSLQHLISLLVEPFCFDYLIKNAISECYIVDLFYLPSGD